MHRSFELTLVVQYCALISLLCVPTSVRAQIQDQLNQANVDKVESFAVDLVASFQDLPPRWAARQRREIVNTIDLVNSKYSIVRVEEVWASDEKGELVYTRFSYGDRNSDGAERGEEGGAFDRDVLTRIQKNRMLHKVGSEPWTLVPKIPNIGSNSTHPFNWALGNLNSAKMGGMQDDGYMKRILWGQNRNSFVAQRDRRGSLTSYWGVEDQKDPPYAFQIVFSKEGLPIDFSLLKFPISTSKASIAKRDFSRLEQTTVQWKKFEQVQRDGKPMSLPVRIEIQSVLNEGEELECVNEIVWKFGKKEVPDSVFVDPQKGEIIEPDFDK